MVSCIPNASPGAVCIPPPHTHSDVTALGDPSLGSHSSSGGKGQVTAKWMQFQLEMQCLELDFEGEGIARKGYQQKKRGRGTSCTRGRERWHGVNHNFSPNPQLTKLTQSQPNPSGHPF